MWYNKKMKEGTPDYFLLTIVAILILFGLLILASVSAPFAQERFNFSFYFLIRQLIFGLLPGLILALFFFKIKIESLKKWVLILFLVNLIFLAMIFLPRLGEELGGAKRWLNLGFISFQPAEFLKLTFILYLALWLEKREEKIKKTKSFSFFLHFLIILSLVSLFLIFQPAISTLLIIILVGFLLYFLAQTPLWQNLLIFFILILIFTSLILISPYRLNRILIFFNPDLDPMGLSYQLKQSLISVGSGGILGTGLGFSKQKFGFLPQAISDSIFAIFAEEMGFILSLILIFLFLLFFWRAFKIAKESEGTFARLTAFGISSWICLQAFFNISSTIGILPIAGLPLPFISYGGSALISQLIGVGILLNISKKNL